MNKNNLILQYECESIGSLISATHDKTTVDVLMDNVVVSQVADMKETIKTLTIELEKERNMGILERLKRKYFN